VKIMNRQGRSPLLPEDVPADPRDARRTNRSRVIRSLITRGPATRAELARRVGLSRPTISVIAAELLAAGLLAEGQRVSSGGAPGTLLEISQDTGVTVVADLHVPGTLRLGAVSVSGEITAGTQMPAHTTGDIHAGVVDFTNHLLPGAVLGIALAVPGWVTPAGEWLGTHADEANPVLEQGLRRELRLAVFAVNAVDAVALADLRDSPPDQAAQATIVLGPRVGMGLIVGGQLRTGLKRPVGDIRHIVPGTSGSICPECGHRCLQQQLQPLLSEHSPDLNQRAADALAAVLAPICGAIELEEIILAGFPDEVAGEISALTAEGLRTRMPVEQAPAVRVSALGDEAVLVGSAAMMLYRRLG
jgi:predicted NBD/HSP70 family sugar kinase